MWQMSQISNGSYREEDKNYKAFKIRVNFSAQVSVHDNGHDGAIRIFMGFSWELHTAAANYSWSERSKNGGQQEEKIHLQG